MRFCFYTDPHFAQNSSIVRSMGTKYSTRLENLINSINWVEELAYNCNCSAIICGGDFFDSTQLNSMEISAMKEIRWAPMTHFFLTGNHEASVSNLQFSTSDIFNLCQSAIVVSSAEEYSFDEADDVDFCFIPYVIEKERKPISEYIKRDAKKRIIFSHNDIKGVQYGQFMTVDGFDIQDIESNCDLFLNGHIHSCSWVTDKIINVGNLTGQNFTEDATKFEHIAVVVDTDTMSVTPYRNPYAFNFYKLDFTDTESAEEVYERLLTLKEYSVLTLKVKEKISLAVKEIINTRFEISNIIESRILIEPENLLMSEGTSDTYALQADDHLKQFENYVLENIGGTSIIKEELFAVTR